MTQNLDLDDDEAADLRRDPAVVEAAPMMPITLVRPVADRDAAPEADLPWGIAAVGADTSPYTGEGVTVAVLDTGIDADHEAFSHLALSRDDIMDFTGDAPVSAVTGDPVGHGTHVAGTVFGGTVGSQRIGVAPGIRRALIGKVLDEHGGSTETICNGMLWAVTQGADVISMSVGIDFTAYLTQLLRSGFPEKVALSRALEAFRANIRLFDRLGDLAGAMVLRGGGAMLVAASGNDSRRDVNMAFTVARVPPSAGDGFVAVGAVGRDKTEDGRFVVAAFSNTGCHLSAPGVDIVSAWPVGGLRVCSGTSMATPHVTGVLALWIQCLFPAGDRPAGWSAAVRRHVEHSVRPLPTQHSSDVGTGLVQAPGSMIR